MSWLLWALAAMVSIVFSTLTLKFLASQGPLSLDLVFSSSKNILASLGVIVLSIATFLAIFNALRDPKISPGVVNAVVGLNIVVVALASIYLYPEAALKPTQILAIVLATASVILLAI